MSALPPKADIGTQSRNVRFVPKADIPPHVASALLVSRLDHPRTVIRIRAGPGYARYSGFHSFATLAAIRRTSSLVVRRGEIIFVGR